MYTIITIYGRVKNSVMPLFIFWIIFLLDLELNFIGKTIGIPMGTNCAPLVADLFLFCYERDFMKSLSRENQADIIEAFFNGYASLFICTTAVRASDSMTASS